MRVVRVGDPSDMHVITVGTEPTPTGVIVGGGTAGATTLDGLNDVDAPTATTPSGIRLEWIRDVTTGHYSLVTATTGGGSSGPLSYTHTQASPSTVWLITHGLEFDPAGVDVLDHLAARHFPLVSYPSAGQVRLDFNVPVRGTARLS